MFEMSTYAVFMLVGFFVMLMIGIPVAISLLARRCSTCCPRASTASSAVTSGWPFRCSSSWA